MPERDRYLDYLRGIAILWVILIHVFYHKQFVPAGSLGEILKQNMLFAMPLIFFVSGGSLYHSHLRQPSSWPFLGRRARRLLLPYAAVALICLGIYFASAAGPAQPFSWRPVLSWLILAPRDVIPRYVGWNMWFVRVMLGVTIAHVGLVRMFGSSRARLPAVALLALGVVWYTVVDPIPPDGTISLALMPRYIVFYGLFLYLGYYYASGRWMLGSRRSTAWLLIVLAGSAAGLWVLARAGIVSGDGQLNKFPPNAGFGLLGLGWLSYWLLMRALVTGAAARLRPLGTTLRFFSDHSYTTYLYHGFAFWATDYALVATRISARLQGAHYAVWIAVYYAFVVVLTVALVLGIDRGAPWLARRLSAALSTLFPSAWKPQRPARAAPSSPGLSRR